MIKGFTHLFNFFLIETGRFRYYKFVSGLKNVETVQKKKLLQYIRVNSETTYGKKHYFNSINNYEDFVNNVPIIEEWNQLTHEIEQIKNGVRLVLTKEKVLAFEETSGNSSSSKLIPYTKGLKNEFHKALQVWMFDLNKNNPNTFYGKAYWSISPPLKKKKTINGLVKIGIGEDRDYFDPISSFILSQTLAFNSSNIKGEVAYDFYFDTMTKLLLEPNLSFISCWSPTFFIQLDKFLRDNKQSLLSEVKHIDKSRYDFIEKIILKTHFNWKELWPNLATISVWKDAQSSIWISQLEEISGQIKIQGKGLLSTEALVTIPFGKLSKTILAYQSHFFEFRHYENKKIFLAHQLTIGALYEVIITTSGGLYRYCTKDIVKVDSYRHSAPNLTFMGRSNRTSDLIGEKVNEIHVNEIINKVFASEMEHIDCIFLIPVIETDKAGYVLCIEGEINKFSIQLNELVQQVENGFNQNPYYEQATSLNQLEPITRKILKRGFKRTLIKKYKEDHMIKDGDIKLPLLFRLNELMGLDFNNENV